MEETKTCSYPECQVEGLVIVKYAPVEVRSCDDHWPALYKQHLLGKSKSNVNLGQTLERWTHVDKKTGNSIAHKLSAGKAWEIENRRVSQDDGVTVVNRATGKPAQL
jgi:hypothetical protein